MVMVMYIAPACSSAVYAVYAMSSLDTEGPQRHRTQNVQLRRDSSDCRAVAVYAVYGLSAVVSMLFMH